MLSRFALPILIVYTAALTIGSLTRVSSMPELGFSFDDKIYHFLAYAVLTVVILNYLAKKKMRKPILIASLIAIIYGIIIEGLQSVLTNFRTPDFFDIIANTLGAASVFLFLKLTSKHKLN